MAITRLYLYFRCDDTRPLFGDGIKTHHFRRKTKGIIASIAHGVGVALYALLTVLGMALIIKETPWLFNIIKYTLWYCLITLILSQSNVLTKLRANTHIIDKVTGIALIGVAMRVMM
jgi:threonine/homoserine/homoserine lactone efflux protein